MKIIEVSEFLENLIEKTENKTEIKFYTRFIKILNQLEKTLLTKEQILLVEEKLEELDFQSIKEKTYRNIKKKFLKFSTYLEEEFKVVQEGYYTSLGMSFGMMIGLATATIF
jgi:hypothetical protein